MSDTTAHLEGANVGLERLRQNLVATTPGLVPEIGDMELWSAIEEFCNRSTYWREQVTWNLAAGQRDYDFNPVAGNAVAAWVMRVEGLVKFNVIPVAILHDLGDVSQARSGCAEVACRPSRLDPYLPGFIIEQWFDTLLAGARQRLFAQVAKPYSNAAMAEYNLKLFRAGIRRARDNVTRGNVAGGTAGWRFPYFARGRATGSWA